MVKPKFRHIRVEHANNHKMMGGNFHDLYHPAPLRWEWINKYFRLVCLLVIVLLDTVMTASHVNGIKRDTVQQPYCWSEYEDVASRAYIAPVVVKAWCTVVYSRSHHPHFNATFHVSKILKGGPHIGKYLEENPRIQLHFGMPSVWTQLPVTAAEIQQESLLRNQVCSIARVDVQKEYLLFLQPHNGLDESGLATNDGGEDMQMESNSLPITPSPAISWSIYAAPEIVTETALTNAHKVLRRAKPPVVAKLRPLNITEGAELALHCRTKGFPHPRVLWYKDGIAIQHRQRKSLAIRNHRRIHRLRIKKSTVEDAGKYRCVAVNVLGAAESETTVTIMSAPDSDHWIVKGVPCPERHFCLNGGSCTFYPRINARSCNCTVGFEGARCELKGGFTMELKERSGAGALEVCAYLTVITNLLCIILLLILLCFAYRYLQTTKKDVPRNNASERSRNPDRTAAATPSNGSESFCTQCQSVTESSRTSTIHQTQADERQTLLTVHTEKHTSRSGPSRPVRPHRNSQFDIPARNGSTVATCNHQHVNHTSADRSIPRSADGQRWVWPPADPTKVTTTSTSLVPPETLVAMQIDQCVQRRVSVAEVRTA
ncbi:pro-neuregulin-2, membrane-bound isoform-like isoform X2 [Paramacrobiotus metropolitanus]|uniref:pro-neuregulin-2, membrane-bound isoform-like isoform X2 n=1 Tax=Paramacrobiotus metropolitanus TaxID=2943436 RepID=UPI0024456239|nr:pro-neuregulin-2, membrane-bound isoform-like isoform X2 [Paramacrobiotus metropolitanus]